MNNEIILFENQNIKLEVNMKDETVWLNANQIAKLFDRDIKTIRKHINNALSEELDNSTVANFATVQLDYYDILYKEDKQVIDNNTLVAITLLIAQSNPKEKEILIDVIMNFLNKKEDDINEWYYFKQ